MTTHDLKTWPIYFRALEAGLKTFEMRVNDRNFALGDFLHLREYEPTANRYTDRTLMFKITYVLPGGQFGILPGWVCLGIRAVIVTANPVAWETLQTPKEKPSLVLRCELRDKNPVMQIIEDERGETHQLTGQEMSDTPGLAIGWTGSLEFYFKGQGRKCAVFERNEKCSMCGVWVPDWVDPSYHDGRLCRPCDSKYFPTQ